MSFYIISNLIVITNDNCYLIHRPKTVNFNIYSIYRVFSAQTDWTLTHTSHKDT
jgi:hypothetical protein